jgi:hypothetical protein
MWIIWGHLSCLVEFFDALGTLAVLNYDGAKSILIYLSLSRREKKERLLY